MARPKKTAAEKPPAPVTPPTGDDEDEEPLPAPVAAPVAAPVKVKAPPVPQPRGRSAGIPEITMARPVIPSRWVMPAEGELLLTFEIANTGGKCEGLYVEIGGPGAPTLAGGAIACDGSSGTLEIKGSSMRGELPKVVIEPGFPDDGNVKPPLPRYSSSRPLEVRLRSKGKADGLVTVRIGPMKAPQGRGSIVQGKQLTTE